MRVQDSAAASVALLAACGGMLVAAGQGQAPTPSQGVLLEPYGAKGEAIFPAVEGWGPDRDGNPVICTLSPAISASSPVATL